MTNGGSLDDSGGPTFILLKCAYCNTSVRRTGHCKSVSFTAASFWYEMGHNSKKLAAVDLDDL